MMQRRAVILCFNASPTPRQQNLFRLLRDMGWRPAYVTWERSGAAKTVPRGNGDYLAIIRLKAPTESARLLFAMPRYWRELSVVIRRVTREEDAAPIIIATHFFHLPLMRKLPSALWMYDAAEYFAFDMSRYLGSFSIIAYPLLAYLEGLGIRRMRAVLAVDSRGGWFETHLLRFNRAVRVVPNVPALADDPAPESVEKSAAEYAGRRVICYVGGLMERKGLEAALDAIELVRQDMPDILLLLIGPYRDDHSKLRELLNQRGLSDHIKVTGPLSYREMLVKITGTEIGLALHQRDPLYAKVGALNGRKIFTYMQAGLAVIAPKFGDIGRVVQETECGELVNTENPADISLALKNLLLNDELRLRFKRNGRRAFEQRYNWEAVARELKPWLLECCVDLPGREKS
ncbi:MAG TPA: glycosyltransferase family 4 protein [Gammaproteobacteria bacterium]|nr:glycosyltransferase family 4 protein [Gammaproteobacteria bacterium]